MQHIVLAMVLSTVWTVCTAAENSHDTQLVEALRRNHEASDGLLHAAMMGGWHQNLTACGLSDENDPFFADGNPIQQQVVHEMRIHVPDLAVSTLNRLYWLAYHKGYKEAEPLFEQKRCRRLDVESVTQAKALWMRKLESLRLPAKTASQPGNN